MENRSVNTPANANYSSITKTDMANVNVDVSPQVDVRWVRPRPMSQPSAQTHDPCTPCTTRCLVEQVDGVTHDQPHAHRRQQQQPAGLEALLQVLRQLAPSPQSLDQQQQHVAAIQGRQWEDVDRGQVDVDDGAELRAGMQWVEERCEQQR